jgi:hypothetical protein
LQQIEVEQGAGLKAQGKSLKLQAQGTRLKGMKDFEFEIFPFTLRLVPCTRSINGYNILQKETRNFRY